MMSIFEKSVWFFLFGFEKNERENITQPELAYLRSAAQLFLAELLAVCILSLSSAFGIEEEQSA